MLVKDIMTMPEFLEYVKQRQSSDDLNNRPNDKEQIMSDINHQEFYEFIAKKQKKHHRQLSYKQCRNLNSLALK